MPRTTALALATAGFVVTGIGLTSVPAQAAEDSCVDVSIANSVGSFEGWQCQDDSGTAVGGQLRDTNRDGKCVVVAVEFPDGLKQTRQACDSQRWPTWVGQSSSYQGVISINVVTV